MIRDTICMGFTCLTTSCTSSYRISSFWLAISLGLIQTIVRANEVTKFKRSKNQTYRRRKGSDHCDTHNPPYSPYQIEGRWIPTFYLTRSGIEPGTSRSVGGRSTNSANGTVGVKYLPLALWAGAPYDTVVGNRDKQCTQAASVPVWIVNITARIGYNSHPTLIRASMKLIYVGAVYSRLAWLIFVPCPTHNQA